MTHTTTACCVVGGGPAGMVLALLLARQGIEVVLLEAHQTFERDFRGETVHPSTRDLIDQLGLTDRLAALGYGGGADFPIHTPDGRLVTPPREPLPTRFPETLSVPQSAFLQMLADVAGAYPTFRLETGARAEHLLEENGRITGVRYRARDGWHDLHAQLVVGADGRFSRIRQLAGLPLMHMAQELDVLWLRLPKLDSDPPRAYGLYPGHGALLVVGDRGDQWQVGFVFPKGTYEQLRQAGLQVLRDRIGVLAPWLANRTGHLDTWSQTSLLVVQAGRVQRWQRPGLLLIGDAAHVMSPVFGVGINYAVQDAVVAANTLGPRLCQGHVDIRDLEKVQRRRERPTRLMQFVQNYGEHQSALRRLTLRDRLATWALEQQPLRQLRARLIAFGGLSPERVEEVDSRRPRLTHRVVSVLGSIVNEVGRSASMSGMWPIMPPLPVPTRRRE